jgi:8-oxo-dGTP pyrophosphatase MutT (NUDIX family)
MSQILVYFAQKAFIVRNGKLLVVRRSPDDPNSAGFWEVPGGRIDSGETLDDHIKREVKEETGLEIEPESPFYVWQWTIKSQQPNSPPQTVVAVARVCKAHSSQLDDKGRVADDFLDEMTWVPLSQLNTINWIPNMVKVIEAFVQVSLEKHL